QGFAHDAERLARFTREASHSAIRLTSSGDRRPSAHFVEEIQEEFDVNGAGAAFGLWNREYHGAFSVGVHIEVEAAGRLKDPRLRPHTWLSRHERVTARRVVDHHDLSTDR